MWSRATKGSDAAQSDFLTFFFYIHAKKVRKYTGSIEKVWLNVFFFYMKVEEKENKRRTTLYYSC